MTFMLPQNKRLTYILSAAAILLLIPFIAMQFTNEVNWTLADFAVAAVLLLGTGLFCELVLRKVTTKRNKLMLCMGILLLCAVVWVELAVGIF